jgi:toxin CcdB
MARFAVYQNRNPHSFGSFPLLVDVQSELLEDLETRVVIPLARAAAFSDFPLRYVMPTVAVEGKAYVLMTPQLTGLSRVTLGPVRGSLETHAREIFVASDMLLKGFAGP